MKPGFSAIVACATIFLGQGVLVSDIEHPDPATASKPHPGMVRLGADTPEDTELFHRQGAYTSPIWCRPVG